MKTTLFRLAAVTVASALTMAHAPAQGDLDPPGIPEPTMKTLDQVEPRTPIDELPVTLTAPGAYYLTKNLTGVSGQAGITVEADDVTIDLAGFVLAGVPGSLDGIVVNETPEPEPVNLVIKNGTVRNWDANGVNAVFSSGGGCFNVRAVSNTKAGLRTGERSIVKDCVATGNFEGGIRGGFHSLISGCMAAGNEQAGIAGEGGATIHDCVAINNPNGAVGIISGDVSVIEGCTSRDNGGNGFFAGAGSVVGRCTATANQGAGVQTLLASTVTECASKNNSGSGVSVDAGTTVRDCVCRDNVINGIEANDRCMLLENNCTENNGSGILVTGGINRIEGNHLTNNDTGLKVEDTGSSNVIVRNTSLGNTTAAYDILGTQAAGPIVPLTGTITTTNPWANFTDPAP